MEDDDAAADAHAGVGAVAAMIGDAEELSWMRALAVTDPAPGAPRDGMPPGEWEPDELGLPPDCPVIPLGVDGDAYWFLDTIGQLRCLVDSKFGQAALTSLFMGRHHFLYWAWPRLNKDKQVVSWRAEKLREDLMGACAQKGPWNAVERARGRGAWRLSDGRLVVHSGDRIIVDGREEALGELEGCVYPTRPPVPRPWSKPLIGKPGPAKDLLPLIKTWNWARPDVDPILFLGWLGAATIGGALPWRPTIFMTGDKATGKSTLQAVIKHVLGAALIQSADTSAAGIYQRLKSDALPVAVDEIEARADSRKVKAVIELARLSSSGALMLRGGESHQGVEFRARSCFAFSSINAPPLEPQDLSRMALLRLYRLPPGAAVPVLDEARLARCGRMILRRMVDGWHRFQATFEAYREVLAGAGHDGRGQDTFGVLLACADLVIDHDAEALGVEMGPAAEDLHSWRAAFAASAMTEYEDAEENWRLCLNHILSTRIEAWRHGTRQTVGEVLHDLYTGDAATLSFDEARKLLQQAGLTLAKPKPSSPTFQLIVPNQNPLLHQLMLGTKWQGEPGAGVWAGALRQAPGGLYEIAQARINGVKSKGTAFDLAVALGYASDGSDVS